MNKSKKRKLYSKAKMWRIETIDEHIHLNEELNKHGLSTKDIGKLCECYQKHGTTRI